MTLCARRPIVRRWSSFVAMATLVAATTSIVAAPAASAAFVHTGGGWSVSYLGVPQNTGVPIPSSPNAVSLVQLSEYDAGDVDGNASNNLRVLRVRSRTGSLGPAFVGVLLNDDPIRFTDGLYVVARERAGVDLDGDGRTDRSGYFWVSGDGTFRFVRPGAPGVYYGPYDGNSSIFTYTVVPFGSSAQASAGIAVLESEEATKIDLDGNGAIEPRSYAAKALLAGGLSGGMATFKGGLPPNGQVQLTPLGSGALGGVAFVSVTGAVRVPPAIAGSVVVTPVSAGYGETMYYTESGVGTIVDEPGQARRILPAGIAGVARSGADWAFAGATETLVGRDIDGDGQVTNAGVTCRIQATTLRECYDLAMQQPISLGDGTWVVAATPMRNAAVHKVAFIDRTGVITTVDGGVGPVVGPGVVVVVQPASSASNGPVSLRIAKNGVLGDVLWTGGNLYDLREVGDGRFFLNVYESQFTSLVGSFVDLNGDGLSGGKVAFFYDGSSLWNTRARIDLAPLYSGKSSLTAQLALGGPLFVSVAEAEPLRDLNGDGDTDDYVLHAVEGKSLVNIAIRVGACCLGGSLPLYNGVGRDRAQFEVYESVMERDLDGSGIIGGNTIAVMEISRTRTVPPSESTSGFAPPTRLLDTRLTSQVGYSGAKPTAGQTLTLKVVGRGGVRTGASAVALNVTATDATAPGYVTVWGEGARPDTSNLNIEREGQTVPNLVVVPVGADGNVRLFTDGGTHLLADVAGWWSAGGGLRAVSPSRLLDSRGGSKPRAGSVTEVQVAGRGGAPQTGSMVAVLNVTATEATGPGFVTVWGDGAQPETSNLNLVAADQTVPNLVMVPVGSDGKVRLFTDAGTHLLVDVTAVYTSGVSLGTARRAIDTRNVTKVAPGGELVVPLGAAASFKAVVLNVTVTEATAPGYVTVWPDGPMPLASNLNIEQVDQTVPNLVVVPVGADGSVRVFASGGAHVIVDVLGGFTA
jgi:hypothetical protein